MGRERGFKHSAIEMDSSSINVNIAQGRFSDTHSATGLQRDDDIPAVEIPLDAPDPEQDAYRSKEASIELSRHTMPAPENGGIDQPHKFALPVDSEFKAKTVRLLSLAQPHMRSFHVSWFAFFMCFLTSFAAAPLLPLIRDNLNLRKEDIGRAGIASVCGSIASRLTMGFACDIVGPRYAGAFAILLTAPAVFYMATVSTATGFILCRFFIGFSLATFVTCQFWMSIMFSSPIVGLVTGITSGCGNLGGGAAQLIMPALVALLSSQRLFGSPDFTAWRISFFIPGTIQVLMGIIMLTCTKDTPLGNYRDLRKSGDRIKDSYVKVIVNGAKNYRTWVLGMAYGFCFGVELTIDNVIAEYFYDKFELTLFVAGVVASLFGLANVFTRPFGGALSDIVARRFGMRGRLWVLWILSTLGGVFCIILPQTEPLGSAIVVLLIFAVFCEGAGGVITSIIPFVSRRSLGIVSGISGAGGNVGAMLLQLLFFTKPSISIDAGLRYMGIMSIACTLIVLTLHFPQWGGMLWGPSKNEDSTEESYYGREWSSEEESMGMHLASMKFAENSKGERGRRKTQPSGILPSRSRRVAAMPTPPHN